MDEQDHADLVLKQRRAIREVMPNATAEEVERLVGALAEIREGVAAVFDHAKMRTKLINAIYHHIPHCSAYDAKMIVGDLSEFVRGIVREEMRATRCTWGRKTTPHHHHNSLGSGGFVCSLDGCAPNTCSTRSAY